MQLNHLSEVGPVVYLCMCTPHIWKDFELGQLLAFIQINQVYSTHLRKWLLCAQNDDALLCLV